MKRNAPIFGLLLGLIFPVIGIGIMYLAWFHGRPFSEFTATMMADHSLFAKVMSLSLIMNLVPFIYFTNKRLDYSARGVLIATVLYALPIVLVKFVL